MARLEFLCKATRKHKKHRFEFLCKATRKHKKHSELCFLCLSWPTPNGYGVTRKIPQIPPSNMIDTCVR